MSEPAQAIEKPKSAFQMMLQKNKQAQSARSCKCPHDAAEPCKGDNSKCSRCLQECVPF